MRCKECEVDEDFQPAVSFVLNDEGYCRNCAFDKALAEIERLASENAILRDECEDSDEMIALLEDKIVSLKKLAKSWCETDRDLRGLPQSLMERRLKALKPEVK